MKALVTGGAGFVGSHLVEALLERGREVIVVDNLSNGRLENLSTVQKQITFRRGDVTEGLNALPNVSGVSEIYHLACHPRQIAFAAPIKDCSTNLLSTVKVLEATKEYNAKVLFTSNTGIVSRPLSLPVNETFSPNPLTPYDVNKLASEYMLKAYSNQYGMKTITVRFASIFGPRQRVNEQLGWRPVIPEFVTKLLRGEPPTIDGDGSLH